jgi:hypothetical protein
MATHPIPDFRYGFTGCDVGTIPNGIIKFAEPFKSGVFDDGFVEAHGLCDFNRGLRFKNVMFRCVIRACFVFVAKSLKNEV